jgi:hypothetical protein
MTERNKMTKAQLAQDKSQDRVQEKVQQRYFSELAKYQEQIRKTQAEAGKGRAA